MNEIERQAMEYLLRGDHPWLALLRDQLRSAAVVNRDLTGVGFFTEFIVPDAVVRISPARRLVIADVYAAVFGLPSPAGFILFVENGALSTLECFIHDDAWPEGARVDRMYYVRPKKPGSCELSETTERDVDWAMNS
jgi:hypothetical protein